jgi:hypothetical protein
MVSFMSNGTASGEVSASGTTMIRPECTVCGCWCGAGVEVVLAMRHLGGAEG